MLLSAAVSAVDHELAAFRAAHPSAREAVAQTDRADWALRLAFEAAKDRRAVVAVGAEHAEYIDKRGKLALLLALLTPYPAPIEAVRRWSGSDDEGLGEMFAKGRASAFAAVFAMAITWGGDRFVVAHGTTGMLRSAADFAIFFFTLAVLRRLVGRLFSSAIERRIAKLDEEAALEIVLKEVAVLSAKYPDDVPVGTMILKKKLLPLVA